MKSDRARTEPSPRFFSDTNQPHDRAPSDLSAVDAPLIGTQATNPLKQLAKLIGGVLTFIRRLLVPVGAGEPRVCCRHECNQLSQGAWFSIHVHTNPEDKQTIERTA